MADTTVPDQTPRPLDVIVVFRALVVASLISCLLSLGLDRFIWSSPYSMYIHVRGFHGYGALLITPSLVGWLTDLLWIATAVGCLSFSPAARVLYLMLTLFDLFTILLGGLIVTTHLHGFLGNVMLLADGAVLAMAYFSPAKEHFEECRRTGTIRAQISRSNGLDLESTVCRSRGFLLHPHETCG